MRYVLAAVVLAFVGAIGVFAVQNTQSVTVRFLNGSLTAPVALLIVVAYVLGMFSGWHVADFLRRSIQRLRAAPRRR